MQSKRCVVLGANGFLGCALTPQLLEAGHHVIACDLAREFSSIAPHSRLECLTLDFLDEVAVREAVAGADWVFHLVSTTKPASSNVNMAFDVQTNVVATIHLLEACAAEGVGRVLFASSGGTVYGIPSSLPVREDMPTLPIVSYGLTKLVIERYAELFERQKGLQTVSLRIGNPYGPRHYDPNQGVIPVFMRQIRQGRQLKIWGDGSIIRDYVYVDDVARAFILAARYAGPLRQFNIASGEGRSVRDIVHQLELLNGAPVEVEYVAARGFDIPAIVLDITRAREVLGWHPGVRFEEGLRLTWEAMSL
ncbi:NAD-dependent epimerase/dehydratase family protein [Aromatoleum buckelii]|uniref:NAD-dependent epimerase/dehydratase family protein n=1 Tax=Aromatoleum buckelii TaxID=200254 RepID=A0ABX1N4B3_9RHOO|nr:NAD-dependent epimerase/dehydratase family protein [Aromatoleum buckelii]MCK0511892.1 NAD-dependent epimerase/dehydratase family protein [Aromatoleum buckelii]